MLERLDYVRLAPRRILDAGSGPPRRESAQALSAARWRSRSISRWRCCPGRHAGAIRRSSESLRCVPTCSACRSPTRRSTWSGRTWRCTGCPTRLPALREFARVLAPNGLLMFSTLGPDSLKELRAAAGAGARARVHRHARRRRHAARGRARGAGDGHGAASARVSGCRYRCSRDLRGSGQTNARADRPRGLAGRAFAQRLRHALGARPKATFEVVYGHAWQAPPAQPDVKTVRVFKSIS